jgi:hypothetical protein
MRVSVEIELMGCCKEEGEGKGETQIESERNWENVRQARTIIASWQGLQ